MKRSKIIQRLEQQGLILPSVISAVLAFTILSMAVLTVIQSNLSIVTRNIESQRAFNIAEAGANYYLWHLSHAPQDFKNGKTTPVTPDANLGFGPYVHDYFDDNGKKTGTYTLWIKPDGNGSTIATVRSIGQSQSSGVKRTIEVKIGATSFASYGLVSDDAFWFGNTEAADGPVHSNVGILMDGSSNGDVTSTNSTYTVPSGLAPSSLQGTTQPGVWCQTTITTPVNCNTRDKSDWRYPVPAVDFNQVSSALCNIKKKAFAAVASTSSIANQANACSQVPTTRTASYLPQRSTTGSYSLTNGYMIELNTNGTYNLYTVAGENDQATAYAAALTETLIASNVTPVSDGVIFAEDNVWVRTNPSFSGRITIASGRLASSTTSTNIVIADDIIYSTKNGADAIGLIAENSVILAPYAMPQTGSFNFEVNAAILAMNGDVIYPLFYRTNSTRCTRGWTAANQTYTFYGSIATRQSWTWTWSLGSSPCGNAVLNGTTYMTGILNNATRYDTNLEYAPPPSYPLTSGHNILSWREVLTTP